MGEFLTHSTAVWLNPHPSLGRIRKDPEMTVFGERALLAVSGGGSKTFVGLLTQTLTEGLSRHVYVCK